MTMDFRLDEAVSLEGLQPGQAIEFDMVEKNDAYIIESIRPAAQ